MRIQIRIEMDTRQIDKVYDFTKFGFTFYKRSLLSSELKHVGDTDIGIVDFRDQGSKLIYEGIYNGESLLEAANIVGIITKKAKDFRYISIKYINDEALAL